MERLPDINPLQGISNNVSSYFQGVISILQAKRMVLLRRNLMEYIMKPKKQKSGVKLVTSKRRSKIRQQPDEKLNAQLLSKGFTIGNMDCITTEPQNQKELLELVELAKLELRPDKYDKTSNRQRAMGKFFVTPRTHQLIDIDRLESDYGDSVCPYFQSSAYNKEVGDLSTDVRLFPAISKETMANSALQRLVLFSLRKAILIGCIEPSDIITSNVQFVQQNVLDSSRRSYTSPAVLHCDGEPFTAIFLAERTDNADGGESFAGRRDQQGKLPENAEPGTIFMEETLLRPFDFLMVDDRAVCHHVNSIGSDNDKPASRMTILIDFSPWRQQLTK